MFQPLWERLLHLAILGQNYWATDLRLSGERKVLDWLASRLPERPTVFDVGANVGDYARAIAERLPEARIFAFEPSAFGFARLSAQVGQLGPAQLTPVRMALGEQAGEGILHSPEPGASTASLLAIRDPYQAFDPSLDEKVPVTSIDRFCADTGVARIDFLKIDVEGFELSVLKGAQAMLRSASIDSIQFEFGAGHVDARTFLRDFYDLLGKDFEMFRVVADGLRPLGAYRPELEQFACVNFLAVRKDWVGRRQGQPLLRNAN